MRIRARAIGIAISFLLSAAVCPAVDLAAGNPSFGQSDVGGGVAGTVIDLNNPASATGTLTDVRFGWGSSPCPAKIKIFHRAGDTLTLAAEQVVSAGTLSGDAYTAVLSPPLPIHQGDLIGIASVPPCGYVVFSTNIFAGRLVEFPGVDVTGSVSLASGTLHNWGLILSGTGIATEYRVGVIPAVGSGPGLNGANFKTSLQMIAPVVGGDVTGRLVFHPVGVGGSVDDPSIDLFIAHNHAISFADVVEAMGQTGFGTLDVVLSVDSAVPVTLARVFNDQGAGGTSGFGEELVPVTGSFSSSGAIVPNGFTGYLSAPVDPDAVRLNLGVRTLDSDSFVSFELKDKQGNLKATAQSSFPPNYFNQFHAQDLFHMALAGDDIVEVSVSTGSAIVSGAATDNVTNDPSVQFVHPVFGIL
ncbi:MAG TPA: hypothetical protein VFS34_15950 [Thermoanaerobaculia bacterium]|nr:hypothetical protein [Thermoanaerobaculia bacterium]